MEDTPAYNPTEPAAQPAAQPVVQPIVQPAAEPVQPVVASTTTTTLTTAEVPTPLSDAAAAKPGRDAANERAIAEHAELTLVEEGPLNGYEHARGRAQVEKPVTPAA